MPGLEQRKPLKEKFSKKAGSNDDEGLSQGEFGELKCLSSALCILVLVLVQTEQ